MYLTTDLVIRMNKNDSYLTFRATLLGSKKSDQEVQNTMKEACA